MKNKISTTLGVLCIVAILATCCITDQNGDPCAVNYVLLAIAAICGIGSKIAEKKYGQVR